MATATTRPNAEGLYAGAMAALGAGRWAEAAQGLTEASQAGHVGAMTQLGSQLFFGRAIQPDARQGWALLVQAAKRGGGAAAATVALILASGIAGPQDWPRALDYLQRAAEAGHAPAQGQLALLADPAGKSHRTGATWAQLRRRVSLDAWRSIPKLHEISADTVIRTLEGFLSPAVCAWIIANAKDRLVPAPVFANEAAAQVRKGIRTNTLAGFDVMNCDLVILMVRERLAAAAGLDVRMLEAAQALHYDPGEEYAAHFDFLTPGFPGHDGMLAAQGQRTLTLLVYLNDGFEGGATAFPTLGVEHRGQTGGLLMFRNVDAAGHPDRRTLHAGTATTVGEKWLLSQWVRDRVQS